MKRMRSVAALMVAILGIAACSDGADSRPTTDERNVGPSADSPPPTAQSLPPSTRSTGEQPPSEDLDIDWLGTLENERDQMRAEGGVFYTGTLTAVATVDGASTDPVTGRAKLATELTVEDLVVLWGIPESTSAGSGAWSVDVTHLSRIDRATIGTLQVPATVDIGVVPTRGVVLFGVIGGNGGADYVDMPNTGSGAVFLDVVAKSLISHGYKKDQTVDICNPIERLRFEHGRPAILAVLEIVPTESGDHSGEADQIASGAGPFTDPVTGDPVEPAINDITRQLREGVDPTEVVIRAQVPMLVRWPDKPMLDVAVFVAAESGAVLGWVHRDPGVVGQREPGEKPETLVEISSPSQGEGVHVYLRPSESNFECPIRGEQPFATVPAAAFGDSERAHIDLETGDVTLRERLG